MSGPQTGEAAKIWCRGNRVCVRIMGSLGESSEFDEAITGKLEEATRKMAITLVVDFEHVQKLLPAGIHMLKDCFQKVTREGGSVRLIDVSESVYDQIDMMGLSRLVTVELTDGTIKSPQDHFGAGDQEKSFEAKKKEAKKAFMEKLKKA